jgi:hypothetical protein
MKTSLMGMLERCFCINVTQISNSYVGSEIVTAVVVKSSVFWDVALRCLFKIRHRYEGMSHRGCCLLHAGFLVRSPTLKMEATCSSETSVGFHRTTCVISQEIEPLIIMIFLRRRLILYYMC